MQEFIDAANCNYGLGNMLTEVCDKGIALAEKYGKVEEVVGYLNELPPAKAFKNPSPGLDEFIARLNDLRVTQENNLEQARTR